MNQDQEFDEVLASISQWMQSQSDDDYEPESEEKFARFIQIIRFADSLGFDFVLPSKPKYLDLDVQLRVDSFDIESEQMERFREVLKLADGFGAEASESGQVLIDFWIKDYYRHK